MLKLVHANDMEFSSVLEYYNSFDNKRNDLNCYAISRVEEGIDKYFDYFSRFEKNLYYLIDDLYPKYIIGFGTINTDYRAIYSNFGNIGYGVRKNERNKGNGTILLQLLLDVCRELGMKEVSVSCLENNIASKRVIEKNNGCFDKRFFNHDGGNYGLKYLISLSLKNVYTSYQFDYVPKVKIAYTPYEPVKYESKKKGLRKLFIFNKK